MSEENNNNSNHFVLRGGSDLLRIAPSEATGDDANAEYQLIREHIASNGDRTLHFSAEVVEIIDATPTTRIVCVTDNALYKFPTSAVQTGLFFDARFPIEKLVQIVAVDNDDQLQGHGLQGLDAQVYVSSDSTGSTVLAFTLNFLSFPARRKLFFLSLSMVKPDIPILLKKRVSQITEEQNNQQQQDEENTPSRQQQNNNSASRRTPPPSSQKKSKIPHYMQTTQSRARTIQAGPSCTFGNNIGSPAPKQPFSAAAAPHNNSSSKAVSGSNQQQKYSPAKFRDNSGNTPSTSNNISPRDGGAGEELDHQSEMNQTVLGSSVPVKELTKEEYERGQKQLHVLLIHDLNPTSQLDMLDPGWRTAHRPPEESIERIAERDEIRAMIYAKEDKIELDARFREKNPKKALTKFARGVCLEFDKAHEERFVPPELSDEMLLGPALYPLWKQWKLSGGLLKVDRSGGDDEDHQWTLFDTNDLISSIRAQEDALLGQIGKKSMFRLQQMRELVEREKKMFMNRKASNKHRPGSGRRGLDDDDYDDDASDISSAIGGARSPYHKKAPTTKPVPFRLSCSPNLERAVKRAKPEVLDLGAVMRTMKDGLMVHRAKLHDLQKTQLVREINRHVGM